MGDLPLPPLSKCSIKSLFTAIGCLSDFGWLHLDEHFQVLRLLHSEDLVIPLTPFSCQSSFLFLFPRDLVFPLLFSQISDSPHLNMGGKRSPFSDLPIFVFAEPNIWPWRLSLIVCLNYIPQWQLVWRQNHIIFSEFSSHLLCVLLSTFPPKNSNNILSSLYPSQTDWMEIRKKSDLRKSPWESSFETSQTHPSLITNIFARQSNLPRNYLRQQDVFSRWHLWLDDMRERESKKYRVSINLCKNPHFLCCMVTSNKKHRIFM